MAEADASIFAAMPAVVEREAADAAALDALLQGAREPFVIRGLVSDWPLVKAGGVSPRAARRYLVERARNVPFAVSIGAPGQGGRLFYDAAMAMNFREARDKLAEAPPVDTATTTGERSMIAPIRKSLRAGRSTTLTSMPRPLSREATALASASSSSATRTV